MKRNLKNDSANHGDNGEKPKERHVVSWSQEDDDILKDKIRVHGTENWAVIASNFNNKSTRQCRRRWFTYLNSDYKKGGWSHEEDMLLCETQKVFGNRWTEIAKVVPGRTDNAVKNRFKTICKKRAITKEESSSSYADSGSENIEPIKKTRFRHHESNVKEASTGEHEFNRASDSSKNTRGTVVEKNDSKILQDFLESNKESDVIAIKDLKETPTYSNESAAPSRRPLENDGVASEYSSTQLISPIRVTPMFRALAETIPSPKFSESERNFLAKALRIESNLPNTRADSSQPPLCKRSLLHCL